MAVTGDFIPKVITAVIIIQATTDTTTIITTRMELTPRRPVLLATNPFILPRGRSATTNAEQANVALIQSNDAAHIFVRVPPDAEVWFGNIKTNTLGVERSFVSPPLESGYEYTYRIRARWDENGRTIDRTRTLSVQPGRMYQLDFLNSADTDQSAQTPASTTQPASQPADNRATNPTNTTNPRDDTSNPRPVPPQQP